MSKSVLDGIKIPGYTNRWSSIDEYKIGEKTYYLMENDTWGDETCLLVITPDFKEIYETYDDIETCLTDEGILTESINKSELKEKYVDVDAFEDKELAQAFEDIEKELDDINKVLDTLYKTPEKYISIKSLKEASGHLYDAWKSLYYAIGKRNNEFQEDLNSGTNTNKFNIKIGAIVESANTDDYKISDIILFDDLSKIDLSESKDGGFRELTEEEFNSEKHTISKEEVQSILSKLSGCEDIHQEDYYKTNKFLKQNSLTLQDCLEIIHKLKVSDYYANTKSTNKDHLDNELIIFEPEVIKLDSGKEFKDLVLYIKIDLDETTNDAVALVSIHRGSQDKLPYKENLMKEERISPKILEKDEDAYKKLDAVAKSLTKKSPNEYTYYVDDTYLDFGSNYKWTTILVDTSSPLNQFEAGYQALNPLEWEDIVNSNKTADEMADKILADEFCPDKPKEDALKSAVHDLRKI